MSAPEYNQSLTDTERFAYLEAMGIVLWAPRTIDSEERQSSGENRSGMENQSVSQNQSVSENQSVAKNQTANKNNQEDPQNTKSESTVSLSNNAASEQSENTQLEYADSADSGHLTGLDEKSLNEESSSPTPDSQVTAVDNKVAATINSQPSRFLKLVPWSSGQPSNHQVLIICRHQVDQPAQSFARPSSPSQFMQDYIKAFHAMLDGSIDCQVKLGHLSQAGLGNECRPFDEAISEITPRLVILLGEETVKEFFGKEQSISQLRGRCLSLENSLKAIVSYHPFSLIKQPQLKSLALEDISLACQLMVAQ